MAGKNPDLSAGGESPKGAEEDKEYHRKFLEMQQYIPFLETMIQRLERSSDKSREAQLSKMKSLYAILSNSKRKLKIETLQRCEDVLKKLMNKVEKTPSQMAKAASAENTDSSVTAAKMGTDKAVDKCDLSDAVVSSTTLEGENTVSDIMLRLKLAAARTRKKEASSPTKKSASKETNISQEESRVSSSQKSSSSLGENSQIVLEQSRERLKKLMDQDPISRPVGLEPDLDQYRKEVPWTRCTSPLSEGSDSINDDPLFQKVVKAELEKKLKMEKSGKKFETSEKLKFLAKEEENSWSNDTVLMKLHSRHSEDDDVSSRSSFQTIGSGAKSPEHSASDKRSVSNESSPTARQKSFSEEPLASPSTVVPSHFSLPASSDSKPISAERDISLKENKVIDSAKEGPTTPKSLRAKLEQEIHKVHRVGVSTGGALRGLVGKDSSKNSKSEGKTLDSEISPPGRSFPPLKFLEGLDKLPSRDDKSKDSPSRTNCPDVKLTRPTDPRRRPSLDRSPSPSRTVRNMSISPPSPVRNVQSSRNVVVMKPFDSSYPGSDKTSGSTEVKCSISALPFPPGCLSHDLDATKRDASGILAKMTPQELQRVVTLNLRNLPDPPAITKEILNSVKGNQISPINCASMPFNPSIPESPFPPPSPAESFHPVGFTSPRDMYGKSMQPQQQFGRPAVTPREDPRISAANNHRSIPVANSTTYDSRFNAPQMQLSGYPAPTGPISNVIRPVTVDCRGSGAYGMDTRVNMSQSSMINVPMSPLPDGQPERMRHQLSGSVQFHQQSVHGLPQGQGPRWAGTPCYGVLSQPRDPQHSPVMPSFGRAMNVYQQQQLQQQKQAEYGQFHGVRDVEPNSHQQWAMHDGSPPIYGPYKSNIGYQRPQGRDPRYPESSNVYPGGRPNFSTPGSAGPRGLGNVRAPGPHAGRNTGTLSERDPRRRSVDEAENDKRPFSREKRPSRPRDPRSSSYESNRDRHRDSADRRRSSDTRRRDSADRKDRDRDLDSSRKRYLNEKTEKAEKTEAKKYDTKLVSPLNSLYGTTCLPKTGKGYGFQNFRIPKIKRDPPVQPKFSTRPPSPKDDPDDLPMTENEKKDESNKTSKNENKTEANMKEKDKEGSKEQSQDMVSKSKEDVTQEWVETLIRKSFESGEGKKLFEHAQFLEKLSESLKEKKFKKIKRILDSDSDDSGSDKANKEEEKPAKVEKEHDDDDFAKNKKSSKALIESDEDEVSKGEKVKNKVVSEVPKVRGKAGRKKSEASLKEEEEKPPVIENDDSKPHKKQCKRRSALELLQNDIRDMFISKGVVTATGYRMCRLLKEAQPGMSLEEISRSEARRMQEEAAEEESDTSSMMGKKRTESEVSEDRTDKRFRGKAKGRTKLYKKKDNKIVNRKGKKLAKGWVMEEYEDASAEDLDEEEEDVIDVVKRRGRKNKGIVIEDSSTEGDKSSDVSPIRIRGKQGKKQSSARRTLEVGPDKELRRRSVPRVILERVDVSSSNEELSSDEYATENFSHADMKKKMSATRGVARQGRRGASHASRRPRRARSASKDGQLEETRKGHPDVSYEIFVPKESFRYKSNRKRVNAPSLLTLNEVINKLSKGSLKCTLDDLFPGKRGTHVKTAQKKTNIKGCETGNKVAGNKFPLSEIVQKQKPVMDDKSCNIKTITDEIYHENDALISEKVEEVTKMVVEETVGGVIPIVKTICRETDKVSKKNNEGVDSSTPNEGPSGDTSQEAKEAVREDVSTEVTEEVKSIESDIVDSKEADSAAPSGPVTAHGADTAVVTPKSAKEEESAKVSDISFKSAPIKLNLVRKAQKKTKKKRAKWQLGIIKKKAAHKPRIETDLAMKQAEEGEEEDEEEEVKERKLARENGTTGMRAEKVVDVMDTEEGAVASASTGSEALCASAEKTVEDNVTLKETKDDKDTDLSVKEPVGIEGQIEGESESMKDKDVSNDGKEIQKKIPKELLEGEGETSDSLSTEVVQNEQNLADISYVFDHMAKRSICKLCPQNRYAKGIVQHYKTFHPDSEVLISRLPVDEACRAVSESEERNYDREGAQDDGTQGSKRKTPGLFACRMCNHTSIYALNFYEHMSAHTGEYRYQCCKCPYVAATRTTFKGHFYNHHPQIKLKQGLSFRLLAEGPSNSTKTLFGYLCSVCNFVQLEKESLEKHISLRHKNEMPAVKSIRINLSKVADRRACEKTDKVDCESLAGDTTISEVNDSEMKIDIVDGNISEDDGSKTALDIIDTLVDAKESTCMVVEESVDEVSTREGEDKNVSAGEKEPLSETDNLPPKKAPMEAFICVSDVEYDDTNVEEERSLKMKEIDKILNITSMLSEVSDDDDSFLSAVINKLNSSPTNIVEVPKEVLQGTSPAVKISVEGEEVSNLNKTSGLNDSSTIVNEHKAIETAQTVMNLLRVENERSEKEREKNIRERRQRNAARKIAELSAIAGKIGIVSPAKMNPDELGDRRVTRSLSKTEEGGESDSEFESDSSSCFEITDDDSDVEFVSSGPDANGIEDGLALLSQDAVQRLVTEIKPEESGTPTEYDGSIAPSCEEDDLPQTPIPLSQEIPLSGDTIPLTGSTISVDSCDAASLATDDTFPLSGVPRGPVPSLDGNSMAPLMSDNMSLLHLSGETIPLSGSASSDASDDTISLGANNLSQASIGTIPLSGNNLSQDSIAMIPLNGNNLSQDSIAMIPLNSNNLSQDSTAMIALSGNDTLSLNDNGGNDAAMPVIGSVMSLHSDDVMPESDDAFDTLANEKAVPPVAGVSTVSVEPGTIASPLFLKVTSKPPPTNPLKVLRPNISVVKRNCALIKVGCLEASKYNNTVVYSCKKPGCIFCSSRLDLFENHIMSTHLQITWDGVCRSCDACVLGLGGSGANGGHSLWFALEHIVKVHLDDPTLVLQGDKASTATPVEETVLPSEGSSTPSMEGEDASNDSTASTEPRKYIRMRRLSGDMLSVPKGLEETEGPVPQEQTEDSVPSLQSTETVDSMPDEEGDCPFLRIESVVSLNPNAPGNESVDNPFSVMGASDADVSSGKVTADVTASADQRVKDLALNSPYGGFRRIVPALLSPTSNATTVTLTSPPRDNYRSVIVTKKRPCYADASKAATSPFKTRLTFSPTKTHMRLIPVPVTAGKMPSTIHLLPNVVGSIPAQTVETVQAKKSVLKSSNIPPPLMDLAQIVRPYSSGLSKDSKQLRNAGNVWPKKVRSILSKATLLTYVQGSGASGPKVSIGQETIMAPETIMTTSSIIPQTVVTTSNMIAETVASRSSIPQSVITAPTILPSTIVSTATIVPSPILSTPAAVPDTITPVSTAMSSSWCQSETTEPCPAPPESDALSKPNFNLRNKLKNQAMLAFEFAKDTKCSETYQEMLCPDRLRDLYKCMGWQCAFSTDVAAKFQVHCQMMMDGVEKMKHKKNATHLKHIFQFSLKPKEWLRCSYCCAQVASPQGLVLHIQAEHAHCLYQCAYCFFRARSHSYVVLHQNTCHTSQRVSVLLCRSPEGLPPPMSAVKPIADVVLIYICNQGSCGERFLVPKKFKRHLEMVHNQVTCFYCHLCTAHCLKPEKLLAHYKLHSYGLYQCQYCIHGTDTKEEMQHHLCKSHVNEPAVVVMRSYRTSETRSVVNPKFLRIIDLEEGTELEGLIQPAMLADVPDDRSQDSLCDFWKHYDADDADASDDAEHSPNILDNAVPAEDSDGSLRSPPQADGVSLTEPLVPANASSSNEVLVPVEASPLVEALPPVPVEALASVQSPLMDTSQTEHEEPETAAGSETSCTDDDILVVDLDSEVEKNLSTAEDDFLLDEGNDDDDDEILILAEKEPPKRLPTVPRVRRKPFVISLSDDEVTVIDTSPVKIDQTRVSAKVIDIEDDYIQQNTVGEVQEPLAPPELPKSTEINSLSQTEMEALVGYQAVEPQLPTNSYDPKEFSQEDAGDLFPQSILQEPMVTLKHRNPLTRDLIANAVDPLQMNSPGNFFMGEPMVTVKHHNPLTVKMLEAAVDPLESDSAQGGVGESLTGNDIPVTGVVDTHCDAVPEGNLLPESGSSGVATEDAFLTTVCASNTETAAVVPLSVIDGASTVSTVATENAMEDDLVTIDDTDTPANMTTPTSEVPQSHVPGTIDLVDVLSKSITNKDCTNETDNDKGVKDNIDSESEAISARLIDSESEAISARLIDSESEAISTRLIDSESEAISARLGDSESEVISTRLCDSESEVISTRLCDSESEAISARLCDSESEAISARLVGFESEAISARLVDSESEAISARLVDSESEAISARLVDSESEATLARLSDSESEAISARLVGSESEAISAGLIDSESEAISARLRTLLRQERAADETASDEGSSRLPSGEELLEVEAPPAKDTTGGGDVVSQPFVEGSGTEGGTSITAADVLSTGHSGEALYRCGNVSCTYSAADAALLRDHLLICDFSRDSAGLMCVHCQRQFKLVNSLLEHLRVHGIWRYGCALCAFRAAVPQQVVKHLKTKHRVTNTRIVPLDPRTTDLDMAMFVLFPKDKMKGRGGKGSSEPRNKAIFSPDETTLLPEKYVILNPMACSICTFKTKVVGNMRRHLAYHDPLGLALDESEVPACESVNPVPCLDKKEMMFDKMTNLAASSHASGRMGGKPAQVTTADGKPAEEETKLPKFVPENQRYVCGAPGCTYLTCDETMLRYHLRALHFDETAYRCPHCPESVQRDSAGLAISIDRLGAHLRMHDSRLYKCVHCPYNHFQRHVVERHLSDKHPEKRPFVQVVREPEGEAAAALGKGDSPSKADASGSTVSGMVQPTKHPWRCGLCKFRCSTRTEVIDHAATAHNIKSQFKCGLCSYRSSSRPNFETHFSSKHPGSDTEIVHVYRRVEETSVGVSIASTAVAGSSSENPSPSTKVSVFDTTPIWRRDMYRIKHIRGILLEEEEESRRYIMEEGRRVRPPESKDPLEEKFGPYGKPAPGNYFVCTRCNKYKTKFKCDMKEHLFRELEYMRWVCTHCSQMSSSKSHLQKHSAKAHDKDRKPEAIAPLKPDLEMDQWVDKLLTTQLNIMRNTAEVQPTALATDIAVKPGPSGVAPYPGPSAVIPSMSDSDSDETPPAKRRSVESWDIVDQWMLEGGDTSPPKLDGDVDVTTLPDELKKKSSVDTKDFKYVCKHCGTKFQAIRGFKIHIRHAHLRLGGWLCGYCSTSSISEFSIKQHCRSLHPDLPEKVVHNETTAGVKLDDDYWEREYGIVPLSKASPTTGLDDSSPAKKKRRLQLLDATTGSDSTALNVSEDAAVARDVKQKCTYCSYHCKYPNDLRNHEMRHWVQKPFKCGYCDFEAIREYEIKKHCARTHPLKKARVIDKPMPSKPDIKPLRWTKRQVDVTGSEALTVSEFESAQGTPEKKPREELKPSSVESTSSTLLKEDQVEVSTSARIFRCFYCPLRATSLSTVHEHWQNIHKVKFLCANGTAKQGLPFRYKEVNVNDYRMFKKKSSYVCLYCKRRGTLEAIHLHHKDAHPNKLFKAVQGSMTQYRCGVCQFLACTVNTLRKHFEIEHIGEEFRYVVKPAKLQDEGSEQVGEAKVSTDSPHRTLPTEPSTLPIVTRFLCSWCDEACDTDDDMQLHHARYHSHLQLKYTIANEEIEKKSKKVKIVPKLRCPKCSYSSNTHQKIFEHLRRHAKPFKCGYCSLSYSFPTKVRVHSSAAHPELQVSIICVKEAEAEMKLLRSQIITFDEEVEVFEDTSNDLGNREDLPTEPVPIQRSISVARKSTTLSSVVHSGKRKFLAVARKSTNSLPRLSFGLKSAIPSETTLSPTSSRSVSPVFPEEFSYYGDKPVLEDLTHVTTMMKYGTTMLNVKFPTVCQILNLNPAVRLVDLKNQGFTPF